MDINPLLDTGKGRFEMEDPKEEEPKNDELTQGNPGYREVLVTRFIPFTLEPKKNETTNVTNDFSTPEWDLEVGLKEEHKTVLKEQIKKIGVGLRNFPVRIDDTSFPNTIPRSSILIYDENTKEDVKVNFLSTIFFNWIFTSRGEKPVDKILVGGLVKAFSSMLDEIALTSTPDLGLVEGLLQAANMILDEFGVDEEMKDRYASVKPSPDRAEIKFLKDIELDFDQSVYFFDSRIGFLINEVYITGLNIVDPELIYSLDFLFRLFTSWFRWNEKNYEQLDELIASIIPSVEPNTLKIFGRQYDTIMFGEDTKVIGLNVNSLIDTPMVHVSSTNLKSNLFLFQNKQPRTLMDQASMRSAIRHSQGLSFPKSPFKKTLLFLNLQLFHEKIQIQRQIEIYKEVWKSWQTELTAALKWNAFHILLTRKMKHLSQLSHDENTVEFYFRQRYGDLNFNVRVEELSKTLLFHVLFIGNRSWSGWFMYNNDFYVKATQDLTYLELINTEAYMSALGEAIQINLDYRSLLDLHESLEKMLETVHELTQTKQQRLITLAVVLFSIVQFVFAIMVF